jgi:hypothetical protein
MTATLAPEGLDAVVDYLRRGRRFSYTPMGTLQTDWVGAYWTWATHRRDATARSLIADSGCELILRNANLPFDQVFDLLLVAQRAISGRG